MSDAAPQRIRTISWDDPMLGAEVAKTMSGLEYMQAMANETLPPPPIFRLLGITGMDVSEGSVTFTLIPAEYHYNPIGSVHGGIAATMLDSAMGCAIHSTLPVGTGYTTLELKLNYIRAMSSKTGEVRCTGTVIHRGGQIATAEGKIVDANGKLYAHGTTTCLLLRP